MFAVLLIRLAGPSALHLCDGCCQ